MHHFKSISEFKLELQSGNAQFGSKSTIFLAVSVTLQFDIWPWKTIGHIFYATSSFVHHFTAIDEFKLELQSGNAQFGSNSMILEPYDLEIWRMTLKNNRTPLLCYFKLCASFRSHWWIQTWPWKIIGHLFYATLSFVHHFVAIGEFRLELQSGNAQSGSNRRILEPCDLEIWRMTSKNNRAPLLSKTIWKNPKMSYSTSHQLLFRNISFKLDHHTGGKWSIHDPKLI